MHPLGPRLATLATCAALAALASAAASSAPAHFPPPLALRQQDGGLQGSGSAPQHASDESGTGSGSGAHVAPHIPALSFTDHAEPWLYKAPYSTDGNLTLSGAAHDRRTTDTSFSSCDGLAGQTVSPDTRINVSAVFAHINPSNHTPGSPAYGMLKIVALGAINAQTDAVKNGSRLVSSVQTNSNFLTFPVSSKLESLCDLIWPVAPDNGHPLAGQYQSCSYGPGQVGFGVSVPLQHEYALGSIDTRIRISDSSTPALTISCIDVTVSPFREHAWYWDFFLWLPAALAIAYFVLTTVSRTVASITLRNLAFKHKARPGGEPHFWKDKLAPTVTDLLTGDSVIRSPALLRFVTPGFCDLFLYIQFVSILSIIAVRWPDYAYTYLRQTAWASLLGNVTLVQPSQADRLHVLSSNAFLPTTSDGSPDFATQMARNASSPLYLDTETPNTFLNLNGSLYGMESYAHVLGLRAVDVFGTTTAIWLIMAGIVTVASLSVWVADMGYTRHLRKRQRDEGYTFDMTEALGGTEKGEHSRLNQRLQNIFGSHVNAYTGNMLRLLVLFHLPLTVTSVYHFSNFASSHAGTTACAALSFAFFCVVAPVMVLWRLSAHPRGALLSDKQLLFSYGPLYNYYDRKSRLFSGISFVHSLALGIVIGAGQESGSAQAIIFVVLEVLLALAYILWLPWGDGATMAPLSFIWSIARIATSVLVLLLSPVVNLSFEARGWITYAILLIQAIMATGFVFLLLVKIAEVVVRLVWRVSFDENKSIRNTGLGGAMHRIRRRKYKTRPGASRKKAKSQAAPPRSRTPSMNLMIGNKTAPTDYASTPYASYFTSEPGDEGDIMSALPPLHGADADQQGKSKGGFVRLGGGRATDEGGVPYDTPVFAGELAHSSQERLGKSRRFGRGRWWRRVPEDSDNESPSSSEDEDAYGGQAHASRHTSPATKPRWGIFRRFGSAPRTAGNDTEEANELTPMSVGAGTPSTPGTPGFAVVRPPRGTLSAMAAAEGPESTPDSDGAQDAARPSATVMEVGPSAAPSSTAGSAATDEKMGSKQALRSASVATRATVESSETDAPRSAHVRAQIRTPQQLYSLSESTHSSEPMSESMFWLPSDSPEVQAALTPAPRIRTAPHMPVAGERERETASVPRVHSHLAATKGPSAPISAADMYSSSEVQAPAKPAAGVARTADVVEMLAPAPAPAPAPATAPVHPQAHARARAPSSAAPQHGLTALASGANQSGVSVNNSMNSRRFVEGQSAEVLMLDED